MNKGIDRRRAVIDAELINLGFSVRMLGFFYIGDGLEIMQDRHVLRTGQVRWIYEEIAKKWTTSCWSVERAVRTAIEDCWLHGDPEGLAQFYPRCTQTGRPTNLEFFNRAHSVVKERVDILRKVK